MSIFGIFFIVYFGIMAACIAHQFIVCQDAAANEFLTKLTGGIVGALLGPFVLGHWWISVEGIWFMPELAGAFIGAVVTAVAWKVLANHAAVASSHVKVKPVM